MHLCSDDGIHEIILIDWALDGNVVCVDIAAELGEWQGLELILTGSGYWIQDIRSGCWGKEGGALLRSSIQNAQTWTGS